jgi:hypothetical protein
MDDQRSSEEGEVTPMMGDSYPNQTAKLFRIQPEDEGRSVARPTL